MTKARTTISIDDHWIKKAKEADINISALVERSIREKCEEVKVPENAIKFKCSECGEIVDFVYICEQNNIAICAKCQENWNPLRCKSDYEEQGCKYHEHIRVPNFNYDNLDVGARFKK